MQMEKIFVVLGVMILSMGCIVNSPTAGKMKVNNGSNDLLNFCGYNPTINQTNQSINQSGFCGTSTMSACNSNLECTTGGCSGEICGSTKDSGSTSICIWKECFDDKKYNVSCKCLNRKCQWN